jgi:hypothetical protein
MGWRERLRRSSSIYYEGDCQILWKRQYSELQVDSEQARSPIVLVREDECDG